MELSEGANGWWCRHGSDLVALLPPEAVHDGRIEPVVERELERAGFYATSERDTYYLTVLPSTSCNLGCAYCFQNVAAAPAGTYRPPRIPHRALKPHTINRLLRFADRQMEAVGVSRLDILLFGGEPLLNREGCLKLLSAARAHGLVHSEIVTNGVLLSAEIGAALELAGLRRVQITFDGDRDDHDQIRVTRRGRATFDRILANMVEVSRATTLPWSLRVNVSERTAAGIPKLLDRLAKHLEPSRCTINFALIEDVGIGYTNSWGPNDETAAHFGAWSVHALELGFDVPFYARLSECSYCSTKRGEGGAVVNADGTLYSCWESVGRDGWEVGDVESGYLEDERLLDSRWVACDYDTIDRDRRAEKSAFKLRVDVTKLDWLYEHGRLTGIKS